jgi:hypothetical protein
MHGTIHVELKKFVEAKHGTDAWKAVLKDAGLSNKIFLANAVYPDQEIVAIVTAASKLTNTPAEHILENFGEFIVPDLMDMFRVLINPKWKTMEMLLNTETTIHTVVRLKNPGAEPPRLQFTQTGPNRLKFNYDSPRQMSAVAKGIMKGVAKHYGETIEIQERKYASGSSEMMITIT